MGYRETFMDGAESKQSRFFDGLWFVAWALGSSIWCLGAAWELGATFDEPIYLKAGLDGWRRGTHEPLLRMGTMPLPADVATLPLYLYERWTGAEVVVGEGDVHGYLFWARATTQIFWWQLLFFACLIGRHLAGPWGGRLATALLACEPNLLAHAALATTDIAAAAFFLPAVYFYARGRTQNWRRRIAWPALWFGGALFAKASALAFVPLAWLFIELHRLWQAGAFALPTADDGCLPTWTTRLRHAVAQLRPWWRDSWSIGLLGLGVVFVLCGSDWQPQRSFLAWARALPDDALGKQVWLWLAENLCIFSNAGHGLAYQIRHNLRGHATYLLGDASPRALWYYFPTLLTIKLPAALLLLLLVVAALRPRALSNWACAAAAGLLVYSLQCKVQIGIRLVLPWVALGIAGLAAALVTACRTSPGWWRGRILASAGAMATAWLAATTVLVWPHGLCHVNEFWGGSERGYALVSDSNYDWGQGMRELARWQHDRQLADLDVWYFGTDPLVSTLPIRRLHAHAMSRQEFLTAVDGRWLAVGTTCVYGPYVPKDAESVQLLRGLHPAARTQTFLIYDFTELGHHKMLAQGN